MMEWLKRVWEKVHTGFWFVPSVMLVLAAVAAWLMLRVDAHLDPGMEAKLRFVYSGGPEGARSLLSTVAGSMITAASVTFSLASVALSLASQQYGSRVLRNFMRDTVTQIMLGIFVATFFYSVLVVRAIRGSDYGGGFVPAISITLGIVLTLLSLLSLVYFVHHVSSSVQASQIIDVIGEDLADSLKSLYPGGVEESPISPAERSSLLTRSQATLAVAASGYLESLNTDGLIQLAEKLGAVIEILVKPGDFLLDGQRVARVHGGPALGRADLKKLLECFHLANERSPEQDIRYQFQQLTDVIVRALSPGINDPFTAINGIDQLSRSALQMARTATTSPQRRGSDGSLRLIVEMPTLLDIMQLTVRHIGIYGATDLFVMSGLRRVLDTVDAELSSEDDHAAIATLRQELDVREDAKKPGN